MMTADHDHHRPGSGTRGSQLLATHLRRLRQQRRRRDTRSVLEPSSAFEAVTRQMVNDLSRDMRDIRGRLNQLLLLVASAILIEALLRMVGLSG